MCVVKDLHKICFYKGGSEPQLIGPQGGCYPAKFHERCWPAHGRNDPIQGVVTQITHYARRVDLDLTPRSRLYRISLR